MITLFKALRASQMLSSAVGACIRMCIDQDTAAVYQEKIVYPQTMI